ncbi:MAG TPA: hypothetical protein DEQ40_19940 [Oxalobacteraceae bacterium]|nr:hypothetical protein [Oxalobacteraceae bacterium]
MHNGTFACRIAAWFLQPFAATFWILFARKLFDKKLIDIDRREWSHTVHENLFSKKIIFSEVAKSAGNHTLVSRKKH